MDTIQILAPSAAFLVTLILLQVFRKAALKTGFVDKPNHRKIHQNPVPAIGGLGIFLGCSFVLGLLIPFNSSVIEFKTIFLPVIVLLLTGLIDDRFDLRASLKLVIQILIAHYIYSQGLKVESLYGLFGIYELSESVQYALTIFVIAGTINAYNLIDGIDGLAAGLAILGFCLYAALAIWTNNLSWALIFSVFIGAIGAFLRFNLSNSKKIFMGDAGSMIIGFVLAGSGLQMIQSVHYTPQVYPVVLGVVAVLFIPVFDALRVFRRRIKIGKSPFNADKTHLHHLALNLGLNHKTTTLGILGFVTFLTTIGFVGLYLAGITVALSIMVLFFILFISILNFNKRIIEWKKHVKHMERMM
jgi:UDP-GlcNAc:undecaprenyl-phosphate/decaprenyl-phosphate GlcNAc-1-phosphate transferase